MQRVRRADRRRRQAGRGERRPRRHRRRRTAAARDVRRPRDGGGLPALLPRRHPPRRPTRASSPTTWPERYELEPEEIATIGDQPNDILMFAHSGLSIAMGNADPQVKQAAREITKSNEEEGFAYAVEHFVLPGAPPPTPPGGSRSARTASGTAGWPSRSGRCGAWPPRSARRRPGRSAPRRCTRTRGR